MKKIPEKIACQCYKIRILCGDVKVKEFQLNKAEINIGRYSNSDIQISDKSISRRHCKCIFDGQQWYLEDQNTTNGTWLLGKAVSSRTVLPLNTPFRAGDALMELCLVTEPVYKTDAEIDKVLICLIDPETLEVNYFNKKAKNEPAPEENQLKSINNFQNLISSLKDDSLSHRLLLEAFLGLVPVSEGCILIYDLETGKHRLNFPLG